MNSSCQLRGCFDHSSHEWKESTLDEKVAILENHVNSGGESTLKMSLDMLDYCNKEAGKDIHQMDLIISMSKIIDHLLKKTKHD